MNTTLKTHLIRQRSLLALLVLVIIVAEKVNYAWLNFPPAHVWVYRRKAQAS